MREFLDNDLVRVALVAGVVVLLILLAWRLFRRRNADVGEWSGESPVFHGPSRLDVITGTIMYWRDRLQHRPAAPPPPLSPLPEISRREEAEMAPPAEAPAPEESEAESSLLPEDETARDLLPVREEEAVEAAPQASEPAPRYANAVLMDATRDQTVNGEKPLVPGQSVSLRLDIGDLSPESRVVRPTALPERLLPKDIWLDVMVSSSDFGIGDTAPGARRGGIAQGRLFLPANGAAAYTPEGNRYLYVSLLAPEQPQLASARIGYYYRNHLVQSQHLMAAIGDEQTYLRREFAGGDAAEDEPESRLVPTTVAGYTIEVDYTLSQSLTGLDGLPSRRQISILTNDNADGAHQIVVRPAGADGNLLGQPVTYELDDDTVGDKVRAMRDVLRNAAPTQKSRSKNQLIDDLKKLAPLGWDLWNAVIPAEHQDATYAALDSQENVVVQITRPTVSSYAFPWSLVYDIPLTSDKLTLCPSIVEWDGRQPFITGDIRRCPRAANGIHDSNTLCPFGFWGYRYGIEQLTSTKERVQEIHAPDQFTFVVGQTLQGVNKDALSAHIQELGRELGQHYAQATLQVGQDLATLHNLLGQDTPLVYFYCHGQHPTTTSPDTFLAIGNGEILKAQDFRGWVLDWQRAQKKTVWRQVLPLVFVNACHSVEIEPRTLVSYLEAFVGAAHAAGVIGTEVKVNQELAMDVAAAFFGRFLDAQTVDQALHGIRLDYLAQGNIFGLIYTPYCWSDLRLVHA